MKKIICEERDKSMANSSLTCKYCGAKNPAGTALCISCGAPIEKPAVAPVTVTTVNTPVSKASAAPAASQRTDTTPEQIRDALDAAPINDQLKEGLKAVGVGAATLGVGTFVARTASEAAAIAFSALLCGYFGSAGGHFGLGLLGGVVIGLLVGLVVKRPLAVLFSAPVGTIIGLAAGSFLQGSMSEWPLIPLMGMVGGGFFAMLGARPNRTNAAAKWYGKLRPFLGMAGGLVFALIGAVIGGLAR